MVADRSTARVLLIYPFGASDLQVPGERQPRGISLVDRVQTILQQQPESLAWQAQGEQHELVVKDSEEKIIARWPMLGDTLRFAIDETLAVTTARDGSLSVHLQPILTKQEPPHDQDTVAFLPILERLQSLWQHGMHLWNSDSPPLSIAVLALWYVTKPPWDTSEMWRLYGEEFYERYKAHAATFVRRYIQTTPGTPAMSFAASTFGRDPDLVFLYTPFGRRTQSVTGFGELRKKATDTLVERSLTTLAWGAAAAALEAPDNGCTPLTGPHPCQQKIAALRALDAWSRRHYRTASSEIDRVSADQAASDFKNLCEALAEPSKQGWSTFWQWAMVDAFNRFLVAKHLQDPGTCLLATYAFNDAFLSYGLAKAFPTLELKPQGRIRILTTPPKSSGDSAYPPWRILATRSAS